MPPAAGVASFWGAIPGAVGVIGGALLGSRSNNRATSLQYKAGQEALAWEKEQEAQRRKEYEEQQARLKAEWEAYQERRRPFRERAEALIRGAGYTPASRPTSSEPPPGWTPPVPGAGGWAPPSSASSSEPLTPPVTLGSTGRGGADVPPLTVPRFRANWNDWSLYG